MKQLAKQKELRELRAKLKTIPMPVRATFVKMHFLKAQTRALSSNVAQFGINTFSK